jgi:hypothetical protein
MAVLDKLGDRRAAATEIVAQDRVDRFARYAVVDQHQR